MHKLDLSKYELRTDLVEDLNPINNGIKTKKYIKNNIDISWIKLNKKNNLNKKAGNYLTLTFDDITDTESKEIVSKVFKEELSLFLKKIGYKKKFKTMIIGLGNSNLAPDRLGPLTLEKIIITNHLYNLNLGVDKRFSKVCGIAPGVTGITGIETSEYIYAIIKKEKPDMVIVIDALASNSINRVNKSIQVTDTGISPGSGIGNKRKEISKNTLKCPVIAIGVPTVVDASVITYDTIKYMIDNNKKLANNEEISKLVDNILSSNSNNFMVTPKEIDFVVECLSEVISYGINKSLHNI